MSYVLRADSFVVLKFSNEEYLRHAGLQPHPFSFVYLSEFVTYKSGQLATFATALERQGETQPVTASGKIRREVPLPSQEKKGGAMQYAL
jgi:NADH dehydrogenase (ubiquinone) Fe-S protein 7